MKQETQPLVLFSWGYWGWGSTARQFVESVDLVEKSRGFNPPIFIDARLRRSVRAPGFRDSAFQQLVGEQRYRWINGLGNKGLDTGVPELNDLKAIPQLLKFADECALQRRRLIYYCACETPGACHRYMITEELVKLAKKQKRNVSVVEWPGTDLPSHHSAGMYRRRYLLPLREAGRILRYLAKYPLPKQLVSDGVRHFYFPLATINFRFLLDQRTYTKSAG